MKGAEDEKKRGNMFCNLECTPIAIVSIRFPYLLALKSFSSKKMLQRQSLNSHHNAYKCFALYFIKHTSYKKWL
jgi:hypothetical protein